MSPRVRVKSFVHKRQPITTTRPLDNSNSDSNLPQNNNTKLLSSDLKALHSIFIRELYKDRKAPVKPFDNNLIFATCSNYLDKEKRSEFFFLFFFWEKKRGQRIALY